MPQVAMSHCYAKGRILHFNFLMLEISQLVSALYDAIITSCVMQRNQFLCFK